LCVMFWGWEGFQVKITIHQQSTRHEMANPEHVKILKEGVEVWNQWRKENPNIAPDLSWERRIGPNLDGADLIGVFRADLNGVDLSEANLKGANLNAAHLSGATLRGASLFKTFLLGADLSGANLNWANLRSAHLRRAQLRGADLTRAHLWSTHFTSVNLEAANFANSMMHGTIFADVDLSQAKGLETVEHSGPSTIGFDTIELSHGKIPDVFLRGAGVSDEFIAVIRAMGGAIQFYSCFISYSTKTSSLPSASMPTSRPGACAAGSRRTTCRAGRSCTSRLTRPSGCMSACC
jgi:Pentapeptide repeats (8 copies)